MAEVHWKTYCHNCKKVIEDDFVKAHSTWGHNASRYCYGTPTQTVKKETVNNEAKTQADSKENRGATI